ncbi:UPF0481 protein At3g47200-like [Typha angustifolia]|uniref:UPF0481 protein At3g47200-like n=1 Tax=Typha angustifolia TaxID=59011 RepID=UPI003C2E4D81
MDNSSESSTSIDISKIMAGTGPVAAEIEEEKDTSGVDVEALASDMATMLGALPKGDPYTISRAPAYVRTGNEKLYEPMVITIGPYHHDWELEAMEKRKLLFVRDLLARSTTKAILEVLLGRMKALENEARRCYSERIDLTSKDFVKMMLLDGCFVIEYLLKFKEEKLFSGVYFIHTDLILMENQIPFFIIEGLFELLVGGAAESRPFLVELIRHMYLKVPSLKIHDSGLPPPAKIHHLLHLYWHWAVPGDKKPSVSDQHSPPLERLICRLFSCFPWRKPVKETSFIPSATELHEAGVTLRKKASPRHMLDITFRNGVMEIPLKKIEDLTKPILTNLVAFEQSMLDGPKNITSFSVLMDSLISKEKDVAILQRCGVIDNWLGSEDEVSRFFNKLCEHAIIDPDDHYFSELFSKVNSYYDTKWHSHRARLVHDYFSSPWSILSLVAALVLLVLTLLQTFFAIYSYFRPF